MPLLLSVLRLSWNSLMHTATSRVLSAWRSRRVHVLRSVRHLQIKQAGVQEMCCQMLWLQLGVGLP
jgi:hypothetical protein